MAILRLTAADSLTQTEVIIRTEDVISVVQDFAGGAPTGIINIQFRNGTGLNFACSDLPRVMRILEVGL